MMGKTSMPDGKATREMASKITLVVGLAGMDLLRYLGKLATAISAITIAITMSAFLLDNIYLGGAHADVFMGLFYVLKGFIGPLTFFIFLCFLGNRIVYQAMIDRDAGLISGSLQGEMKERPVPAVDEKA